MVFLKELVRAKGANLITQTIVGDLFDQEVSLLSHFKADAIINCTGLAGTELADDKSCYPIRGALLRVINDGTDFPKIEHALSITAGAMHASSQMVFLVPRNDNILLVGGLTQPHEGKLDLTVDSPVIKKMRARCEDFLPCLKNAKLDSDYPLTQGLRPFRQHNVRVERELRSHVQDKNGPSTVSRIIHSYGHGGAGK